jgi:hypothetical protein
MNRPPILSDACWNALDAAGRAQLSDAWSELQSLPPSAAWARFGELTRGLYAFNEVCRITTTAERLFEAQARGEGVFPYAYHKQDRLGVLLPLLNDSELDELETLARWGANAEHDEDRVYLSGELEAHLQRLEKRLS